MRIHHLSRCFYPYICFGAVSSLPRERLGFAQGGVGKRRGRNKSGGDSAGDEGAGSRLAPPDPREPFPGTSPAPSTAPEPGTPCPGGTGNINYPKMGGGTSEHAEPPP